MYIHIYTYIYISMTFIKALELTMLLILLDIQNHTYINIYVCVTRVCVAESLNTAERLPGAVQGKGCKLGKQQPRQQRLGLLRSFKRAIGLRVIIGERLRDYRV